MKKTLIALSLIGVLISCSSPLDKKYNEDTLVEDTKDIKETSDISEEDTELMAGWIMRAKWIDATLDDKTYGEIIEEAKNYKKEQKKRAEKKKLEGEHKRQKLDAALTVAMYDKGYEEYNYQKYLTYSFAFENKTDKTIRTFKGAVSIRDLFDTEIKSINLTIDDPITTGETFKGTYSTAYNQFRTEDSRLKGKDMEALKVVWIPEKIIFMDGSTLE
ncbi:hypothetical protein ES676_10540 [Bizionia saleffrena]|uniref:Lipoprotein n=1 Tax=Bizionia saleffrena TaxID=291189 RepID=A0A8H2LG41_9FLAO|nr:hypothetical protein [Bizionia saleffrena]TYB72605.1 hypothetical protein ES676_10540 [Bizionia saleffrena]